MSETYKQGDLVRLKSGGPLMTVLYTQPLSSGEDSVACTWFDSRKNEKRGYYPGGVLDRDDGITIA